MRKFILILSLSILSLAGHSQCSVQITTVSATCFGMCNGSATAIPTGQSPFTFSWSPVSQFTQTATGLCAGVYTVFVTDVNGCTSSAVSVVSQPSQINLNVSVTNASCNGLCNGSASVTASGGTPGYTFSWAPGGQTTASVIGLCAGSYTVIVTDANACTRMASVTINQPTPITLSLSQNDPSCYGSCNGSASVLPSGGTAPYIYQWSTGQTTAMATSLCAGTYTVMVTDAAGCTAVSSITITQPTPLIVTTSSTTESCQNCCDATATVNPSGGVGPYSFSWSCAPPQYTQTATGLCSGTYTVCVTDINMCTNCDTITISPFVGMALTENDPKLKLTPNPSTGLILLEFNSPKAGAVHLLLLNVMGQTLVEEDHSVTKPNFKTSIDLSTLPRGIYFIRLSTSEGVITERLVLD